MRPRSILAALMPLLGLLALPGCEDDAPKRALARDARPAEAGEGPRKGWVLHVEGEVIVQPAGREAFAARPHVSLLASDELKPAPAAFALVLLENGHVVRVDDVHALKVSDILLLEAPRASDDVAAQVAALLRPEERARVPSPEELRERVAK